MKKIKLISTGGTIAGTGNNNLDFKDYVAGELKGEAILDRIPEIRDQVNIDIEQFSNFGSSNMTTAHWIMLKKSVESALSDNDFDGAVITHGTGTLEETAYFLNLTVNSSKPIVLVGSQRPISAISSDAMLNLFNAVSVAANDESNGKGVLVVFNNLIFDGRNVSKTNTYSLEAFQSRDFGPIGLIDQALNVEFYQKPIRKHTTNSIFSKMPLEDIPDVGIFYSYAGADGKLIDFALQNKLYAGMVLAGTGSGHGSSKEISSLLIAQQKNIPIVRSSRTGSGKLVKINKAKWKDTIMADNLLPHKARILLGLSILKSKDTKYIQNIFDEY